MTDVKMNSRFSLAVITVFAMAGGCSRLPDTGITLLKPSSLSELQKDLTSHSENTLKLDIFGHKADLERFRLRGPFAVEEKEDYEIRLSTTEKINTDLFFSIHAEKAPLVIFLHGYDRSKEDHSYQALHVASWGMHSLAIQLPDKGPWVANGRTLAKLINFIHRWPEIVDNRVDLNKIVLVGHSFGGAAVAVALAEGAPVMGGILLDPAAISRDMPGYLRRIDKPVMVLGADEQVYQARNRDSFYQFIRSGVSEVSIKDATHEDAQFASRLLLGAADSQVTFVSAITSAAFSLSSTGRFDYAWASFAEELAGGRLVNAKRK